MGFTKIDELLLGQHSDLLETDHCIFLREYDADANFKSKTYSLIWNLKKKPSTKSVKDGYHYKNSAIVEVSNELRLALSSTWLDTGTLVPTPGSKIPGHIDYDNRMTSICNCIRPNLDVRELVKQTKSTEASHEGKRLSVSDLLGVYQIDESLTQPAPTSIAIFDDVLTIGSHYRAMHTVLSNRFPGVPIFGIFIARNV